MNNFRVYKLSEEFKAHGCDWQTGNVATDLMTFRFMECIKMTGCLDALDTTQNLSVFLQSTMRDD
jgi:hypothetical protein